MRKLALIRKGLVLLILVYQLQITTTAQEFGRSPFRECWRLENENINNFAIASDNALNLFLSLSGGLVQAVDKELGTVIWQSEVGGEIIAPVISDERRLFVTSRISLLKEAQDKPSITFNVRALSILTGITNWQKSFSISENEKVHLVQDSEKLYVLTETGNLYILNKQTGETCLEKTLGLKISAVPFLSEGKIYLGTFEKKLLVVSVDGFRVESELDLKNVPTSILALGNNALYLGDDLGNVLAFNPLKKEVRWKTWTGAEITNIKKVSKGLLVSSFDNYVYLISEKNGRRIWKKRLSGRSVGSPLIKDDVAVFSTLGGTDAVFIELTKGKSVNQISIQGENYFIHNPSGFDDLVVFPTFKGLVAFGSGRNCKNIK